MIAEQQREVVLSFWAGLSPYEQQGYLQARIFTDIDFEILWPVMSTSQKLYVAQHHLLNGNQVRRLLGLPTSYEQERPNESMAR